MFWSLAKIIFTSSNVERFGKSLYSGNSKKRQCPVIFFEYVMSVKTGIHLASMDSRLRGNNRLKMGITFVTVY
jgi:hypothetical protein